MVANNRIFVQIASYRDAELTATLDDCIFKADAPDQLVFSIAWQHCDEEYAKVEPILKELSKKSLLKVISIPWELSRGACWARNMLQQQYDGEKYTLHLDSHHRFKAGWDTSLKTDLNNLIAQGFSKPVLTGYLNRYLPPDTLDYYKNTDWGKKTPDIERHCVEPRASTDKLDANPIKICVLSFTHDGIPHPKPKHISEEDESDSPIPAYFYSGHFCFSLGILTTEVPHDPAIYFVGEEPTIALRAYTHGYDLFHPVNSYIWHEYDRSYTKRKHWVDHTEENRDEIEDNVLWHDRELYSQQRCLSLFGVLDEPIDLGEFGLGSQRTIEDFMEFSRIDYRYRAIRLDNGDLQYTVPVKIEASVFNNIDKADIKFICCAAHGDNDDTLFRLDITADSHPQAWEDEEFGFELVFKSAIPPTYYVVWPCLKNEEWCNHQQVIIWNRHGN